MLIIGISLFYLFKEPLTAYLKKGGSDYFARRNILWTPSYNAALNGGIFGLGYGVSDTKVKTLYMKENTFGEIKREKGNSILAIVEETGIIGLTLFLLPIGYLGKEFFNRYRLSTNFLNSNFEFIIGFSFLIAFILHAQFEAWWVGVSSFYLFIFFIINTILIEK